MNPTVQRYLPPILVFGAALYFGWPPAEPLDLGEDVVRANSVRWRPEDLAEPVVIKPAADPFEAVLVASDEMEVEPETGKLVAATTPPGPAPEVIQAGLQLDGIAMMGNRLWAVLNGRPRLPGDLILTNDANRHTCEIVSVHSDRIVVRCEETLAEIRPRPAGTARPVAAKHAPTATEGNTPTAPVGIVPPPPNA